MTKKDRIAIVVSVLYFLYPLAVIFSGQSNSPQGLIFVVISPLVAYWGYRFIKGDISFLGKGGNKDE